MTTRVVHLRSKEWAETPPADRVRIDRRGKWGNPWKIGPGWTREQVIHAYRRWVTGNDQGDSLEPMIRRELRGKVLGCWCAPRPCHGDVLAEIADGVVEAPSGERGEG